MRGRGNNPTTSVTKKRSPDERSDIRDHGAWRPGCRYAHPGYKVYASPRSDGAQSPNTIFATISRWISDEPPKIVYARPLRYSGTTGSNSSGCPAASLGGERGRTGPT